MSYEIWKFQLPVKDEFILEIPQVEQMLSVQVQGSNICLWAIVSTLLDAEKYKFYCVGTGLEFDAIGKSYIGTVQYNGFVWHYFYEKIA